MKAKILFLVVLFMGAGLFSTASAQVPQMINYQGTLTDTLGNQLNGSYNIAFSIYDTSTGGVALWTETQNGVSVENGIFSILLGSVTSIPFSVFNGQTRYLGIAVSPDPEMTPRREIVSVAYAYKSLKADTAGFALNAGMLQGNDLLAFDQRYVNVIGPDSVKLGSYFSPALLVKNTAGGAGLNGEGYGSSSVSTSGIYGYAKNSSTGTAYGGFFRADSAGTGVHYGLLSDSYSSSSNWNVGVYGYAQNSSSGQPMGGYFVTSGVGTGTHYGLCGEGFSASGYPTYGTYGYAENTSSGNAHGGYFETSSLGTGTHYGLVARGYGASSITCGTYGYAENTSSNEAMGGWFSADDAGSGVHYGLYVSSLGASSATTYGTYCDAQNTSSGNAYGGRFSVSSSGTGTHYGVYGVEAAGGSGAAVYASGDMIASGAKPAVVKTSSGHRLLYAQESPEVWFEDFGEGQLVSGRAHIELDPLFLETVTINADNPMKVFIQLNDENCKGAAVRRGITGFDVVELQGGTSSVSFSYRVVAKRTGYEMERLRETDVGYDDPNLYPELKAEIENRHEEKRQMQKIERQNHQQEQDRMREEQKRMEKRE